MAKCEFCDKGVTFGIQVSHSHRRSNRTWKPNVKRVKAIVNGSPRHVYVCTRCMRSGKVTRAIQCTDKAPGLLSWWFSILRYYHESFLPLQKYKLPLSPLQSYIWLLPMYRKGTAKARNSKLLFRPRHFPRRTGQ